LCQTRETIGKVTLAGDSYVLRAVVPKQHGAKRAMRAGGLSPHALKWWSATRNGRF